MLPDVERIMNSTPHSVTGTSPVKIVFGTSVDLSRGIMKPFNEADLPTRIDFKDFVIRQSIFQNEAILLAQSKQLERERKIALYAADKENQTITAYLPGSFVLLKVDNNKRNQADDKLSPRWTGPYRVISSSHNEHRYEIEDIPTGVLRKVHVTELKPFCYDPAVDPNLIAIEKAEHYIVESIVQHRTHSETHALPKKKNAPPNKKIYEFLVHWKDYPESSRTWEPITNLRANSVFHEYCKQHKLTSLIPKRFQEDD